MKGEYIFLICIGLFFYYYFVIKKAESTSTQKASDVLTVEEEKARANRENPQKDFVSKPFPKENIRTYNITPKIIG